MGDFHLTVKVRNGRIVKRMRELGIRNAAELARLTGLGHDVIGGYLSFKLSPIRQSKHGPRIDWTAGAMRISAALRVEPEFLWPEHLARLKAARSEVEFFTDDPRLIANDHYIDRAAFSRLLAPLDVREREIINRRFGLNDSPIETCEEIASRMGVSSARIQQLEHLALKRMRAPARLRLAHDVIVEK